VKQGRAGLAELRVSSFSSSRHITGLSEFHCGLGFTAARRTLKSAGSRSREIRYSPSCLDFGSCGADLRMRQNSEPRNQATKVRLRLP
jgi:glucan biosynthesis protein